jgi:streptomycin 6-kinase
MGEAGRAWLTGLPRQIAELERCWAIKVGEPARRGTEAFVAEARTQDGRDVVVKIVIPGIDPMRQELRILQAARGVGYARLILDDEIANAMLLDRLGPQLHEFRLTEDERIRIICATLREAWSVPSEGLDVPTGAERAAELSRLIESLWGPLGRPCSERAVARALSFAEKRRRAFDPARSVLAHGDAHEWNTLKAPDSPTGFKFVDPDGAVAERAFDLAIPLREWGAVMPDGDPVRLARRRCDLLSRLSGVPHQPIWEWGLIQCVSNGLLLHQLALEAPASVEFAMADAWTVSADPFGS